MRIYRCPECGMRLKTNYCDICMRKVPVKAVSSEQTWQHAEGSSAHKEEKHPCVTFDEPKKRTRTAPQRPVTGRKRTQTRAVGKKLTVMAVVIAVLAVITSVFGMVSELVEEELTPQYHYEAYEVAADVPQITPTQLYNDGQIVITADSAGTYYDDYTISLTIQNGAKQDITVNSQMLSVNGYMLTCDFYAEVEAGQTQQALLQLYSYELEETGITDVADISFYLNLYDSDDYTDIATTELLTLHTDIAQAYVQPVDDSGLELYHDGGVRLVLRGTRLSSYGDCDLEVFVENLSEQTVSVFTESIRMDGQEVPGFMWNTLRPDTRAIDSIYIYELEELDITDLSQVSQIDVDLYIEYMQDGYVEQTVYETVTIRTETLR